MADKATLAESKRYKLTRKHKDAVAKLLQGKLSYAKAAAIFEVVPQQLPGIITSILRRLTMQGEINIEEVIKKY